MADSDNNRVLKRTIKLKGRNLQPYEKKFRHQGEYKYDIPIKSRIPEGHPKVCYDRNPAVNQSAVSCEQAPHQAGPSSLTSSQLPVYSECGNSSSCNVLTAEISSSSSRFDSPENELTNSELCDNSIIEGTPFLNEIESYYHQLKIENAISIFSDQGRILVIKDYCYDRQKLNCWKYILIERKSTDFNGTQLQWMYWCSCNESKARQLAGLEHRLNLSYEGSFTFNYIYSFLRQSSSLFCRCEISHIYSCGIFIA